MNAFERLLEEQGIEIAVGMILGIGFLVFLVIVIALGDRKPPDT